MKSADETLYAALVQFLHERKLQLGESPLDDLVIPIRNARELRVPIQFLLDLKPV